jgi:hypothetical protein
MRERQLLRDMFEAAIAAAWLGSTETIRAPLPLQLNLVAEFDPPPSPDCANLNEFGQRLEIDANEN